MLNPSSLISALLREVWTKNPEEFKIDCLSGIANLFPETVDPFYAGFGNKTNDEKAYRTVRPTLLMTKFVDPMFSAIIGEDSRQKNIYNR